MIVTEVVPPTLQAMDVASPGTMADASRQWLTSLYHRADERYVRLNMITSLTGSASGSDGTSETLTSPVDRTILSTIRRDADVVVVGAQSVRAEGYVVPRTARLGIVTTTGDLRGHRLDVEGETSDRLFLICPAESEADVRAHADAMGATVIAVASRSGRARALDPRDIVDALARQGLKRVVIEGGPSLAAQFTAAGVIDEYCVTVAPVLEPATAPFISVSAAARPDTRVAGMLVDEAGFSYLRLAASRSDPERAANRR